MEPKGEAMMTEGVQTAMGSLDCPICHEPLAPPIYQCGTGHLLCRSCRFRYMLCPAPLCDSRRTTRCSDMERVVEAIEVPCGFAKHGCWEKMVYFKRAKHEKACQHGPCFCPEPDCYFRGPSAALPGHFTRHHDWPSKEFRYYMKFYVPVQPGPHVLHAQDGSSVFLVNMVPVPASGEPLGHAISVVCVQPQPETATGSKRSRFGLSLTFSCFKGHHQLLTLDDVRSSSLADGLPKDVVCFVPKDIAVLSITIDTEKAFDDKALEDGDSEDENYDEDYEED